MPKRKMLAIIRSNHVTPCELSAYASGALVKCRKVGAKNWGNKTKKEGYEFSDWRDDFKPTEIQSFDIVKQNLWLMLIPSPNLYNWQQKIIKDYNLLVTFSV